MLGAVATDALIVLAVSVEVSAPRQWIVGGARLLQ
jgi:hypothetical protein